MKHVFLFLAGLLCGVGALGVFGLYAGYGWPYDIAHTSISQITSRIQNEQGEQQTNAPIQVESFERIHTILENNYYQPELLDTQQMNRAALKSYVNALDDPFTTYLDAEENKGLMESLEGSTDFEGIGAVVTKKEEGVMIEEVLKGSPAFLAGLRPLDVIVQVGDVDVVDMPLDEAVSLIRGPQGSVVELTILREDDGIAEVLTISVQRDTIVVPSVTSDIVQGEGEYGYISLALIGEQTEELLRKEIIALQEQGSLDGLIIDVRGNGGGILGVAVAILSHFVPENEVIVRTRYRNIPGQVYRSYGPQDFSDIPVVVLIDEFTASAGEIIALALQQNIGAILVGKQTFGKGSIQTVHRFADGASLKYTMGRRYGPNNETIDGVGVEPDVQVDLDVDAYREQDRDTQKEKAIEILDMSQ